MSAPPGGSAPFLKRHAVSLPLCTDRPQWYPLGPIFWPSFCISVSFGNGPAASLRLTPFQCWQRCSVCPVAAGTRCETCSCLRHLGGGIFFSHVPFGSCSQVFFSGELCLTFYSWCSMLGQRTNATHTGCDILRSNPPYPLAQLTTHMSSAVCTCVTVPLDSCVWSGFQCGL